MRTRTRVVGVAIAVAAVGALVASTATMGVPVAWKEHAPVAQSGPESVTTTAAGASPRKATASKPPKGSVAQPQGITELRAKGAVALSPQGAVASVAGTKLGADGADAFVHRYAGAFGLTDAHGLTKVDTQKLGADTVTRYAQTAGGLPVFGGEIVVTSRGKTVRSALATATSDAPGGTATVTAAKAGDVALQAAADRLKLTGLHVAATKQWQYDAAVIGGTGPAGMRPTWQVDLSDSTASAASVLVDAIDGSVRIATSTRESVRNRVICDLANHPVNLDLRSAYSCPGAVTVSRSEGGAAAGVAEVNNVYDLLGKIYDFYHGLGIDSFDDQGSQIKATVRACDSNLPAVYCPYPNAFWEGSQFVFGDGYAVDDVVAHEFTHAVTEHSSHLMYIYQPGALNEGLSDIMGELFDQSSTQPGEVEQPWLIGEDLPGGGAIRSMSNPEAYGQPSTVGGTDWAYGDDDNGGVHTNSGPLNFAAYQIAQKIGNAKSLQLWWRVEHVLPAGASYPIMGNAITTACTQLIGVTAITAADCADIWSTALGLDGGNYPFSLAPQCNVGQPQAIYSEGFEVPNSWKTSGNWAFLPAPNAQYQFAAAGHGSLNGWINEGGSGSGGTATMPGAVTLPSTGKTYVYLAHAALTNFAYAYLEMNVNGTGWKAASFAQTWGGTSPLQPVSDYISATANISSLNGKRVQFRVRLSGTRAFDYYLDDFRIYQCVEKPAPGYFGATLTGHTGTISRVPVPTGPYVPSGQTIDHYEYVFHPAIPGAPTTSANGNLTIQNVPTDVYAVKIRAVTNIGVVSDWTTVRMAASPPRACQDEAYPVSLMASVMCRQLKMPGVARK